MPMGLSSLGRSLEEVSLPPVLAVLFGAVAAILVVATPEWMFDQMILASGIPLIAPSVSPPFGEVARIIAAIAAMWLVAGILWPAFALVSALLAPKPQKGKGFRIEASFDVSVPPLQFETLIRSPVGDDLGLGLAPGTPVDHAASRIKAVVRRAANSNELDTAPGEVPLKTKIALPEVGADELHQTERETASDAIASRSIEPRKYKTRKRHQLPNESVDASGKTLGGSETRH